MNNIESVIHEYFKEYAGLDELDNASLIVVRRDGIPLYTFKGHDSDWNEASVAALLSGMWQAAETLTGFIPNGDEGTFRFSFDTSSKGIYIIELKGEFEPLYLAYIYHDLENPGKMKSQIRLMESSLSEFIDENMASQEDTKEGCEEFLFNDISDDELDDLFADVIAE